MKINKVSLIAMLALGGLVAFSLPTRAQDTNKPAPPPGGQHVGKDRMAMIAEQLQLTDDQKPKLAALMKDEMDQQRTLRGDKTLSREDIMAKVKTIRAATVEKVKGILTPDQFEKWQKMRERRPGGPRGPGGPGGTNAPNGQAQPPGAPPGDAPKN